MTREVLLERILSYFDNDDCTIEITGNHVGLDGYFNADHLAGFILQESRKPTE